MDKVGNIKNQRGENWGRLSHKMEIFDMLRRNLKEIFSLGNNNNSKNKNGS